MGTGIRRSSAAVPSSRAPASPTVAQPHSDPSSSSPVVLGGVAIMARGPPRPRARAARSAPGRRRRPASAGGIVSLGSPSSCGATSATKRLGRMRDPGCSTVVTSSRSRARVMATNRRRRSSSSANWAGGVCLSSSTGSSRRSPRVSGNWPSTTRGTTTAGYSRPLAW